MCRGGQQARAAGDHYAQPWQPKRPLSTGGGSGDAGRLHIFSNGSFCCKIEQSTWQEDVPGNSCQCPRMVAGHAGGIARAKGQAEDLKPAGFKVSAVDAAAGQGREAFLACITCILRQLQPPKYASISVACSTLGQLTKREVTAVIMAAQRRCFCMYIPHPRTNACCI